MVAIVLCSNGSLSRTDQITLRALELSGCILIQQNLARRQGFEQDMVFADFPALLKSQQVVFFRCAT